MKKCLLLATGLLLLLMAGCTGQLQSTDGATKLESIAAYPETLKMEKGKSEVIQVALTPSQAQEKDLIWASSDKSVATVDASGMVSAIADGTCTITVASKAYSDVSCYVEVIVGNGTASAAPSQSAASQTSGSSQVVGYVAETNASAVYPTYYLSESEVSRMDGDEIQFIINQIYAKNGYIFRTENIQSYFSKMPWYVPVSNDSSRLQMSSLDRSNLNLLVRARDSMPSSNTSSVGWIWTYNVVSSPLTENYVRNLSTYDVQLLINTIYAKNGYIFETDNLQAMFGGQPWYHGVTRDASGISFTQTDKANLRLLTSYRS